MSRNTIFVEEAKILTHEDYGGEQHILRLHAPHTAIHARPGSFVHLCCDPLLPMRRPLSIMRAGRDEGWVDLLYRVVGTGTRLLARRRPGEHLSLLGPIGNAFTIHEKKSRPLLIGGGVGIPPIVFLAEESLASPAGYAPLVLMGSETPFPFTPCASRIQVAGPPAGADAAMPLMEQWGIPSRLTSLQGYPGCFAGYVTDLARGCLESMGPEQRAETEIFACGPHPMLETVAALAREYQLPCQVSLEEFMACAVGGCAGCAVKVHTPSGPAMQRVCVDGPVFESGRVFPPEGLT